MRSPTPDDGRLSVSAVRPRVPATVQQPRPLVVSAGASSAGQRVADMVFVPGQTPLATCRERMNGIRAETSQSGRHPDDVRFQMHASVVERASSAEAREVADEIELLHREFGCGGVAITLPFWQPAEVLRLGALLVPELERRGL